MRMRRTTIGGSLLLLVACVPGAPSAQDNEGIQDVLAKLERAYETCNADYILEVILPTSRAQYETASDREKYERRTELSGMLCDDEKKQAAQLLAVRTAQGARIIVAENGLTASIDMAGTGLKEAGGRESFRFTK